MKDKGFIDKRLFHTRNEIKAAGLALHIIQNTQELTELRQAWQDLVNRLGKAWVKAKLECEAANMECDNIRFKPVRQELNRVTQLKKSDELLIYLFQARNASEHTLQFDSTLQDIITISVPSGGLVKYSPHEGTIQPLNCGISVTYGRHFTLLKIENRGVTFDPPLVHLGKSLHFYDKHENMTNFSHFLLYKFPNRMMVRNCITPKHAPYFHISE